MSDNKMATKSDLKEMYNRILPYLGVNPSLDYSTDEKVVGTWIDGSTLYQKTVTTGGDVPTGATLIQREAQTGYDTLKYTKS